MTFRQLNEDESPRKTIRSAQVYCFHSNKGKAAFDLRQSFSGGESHVTRGWSPSHYQIPGVQPRKPHCQRRVQSAKNIVNRISFWHFNSRLSLSKLQVLSKVSPPSKFQNEPNNLGLKLKVQDRKHSKSKRRPLPGQQQWVKSGGKQSWTILVVQNTGPRSHGNLLHIISWGKGSLSQRDLHTSLLSWRKTLLSDLPPSDLSHPPTDMLPPPLMCHAPSDTVIPLWLVIPPRRARQWWQRSTLALGAKSPVFFLSAWQQFHALYACVWR